MNHPDRLTAIRIEIAGKNYESALQMGAPSLNEDAVRRTYSC
jgi:hypothetical protein